MAFYTQEGNITIWDRSTLYSIRGLFKVGYADDALRCSALQQPHQRVPSDLHGALRAELLTAEAADAFAAVDDRLFALHGDRVRRTDLCAC